MSDLPSSVRSAPERIRALHQSGLLDSTSEPTFDRLTRLAVRLVDAPVAFVSLVDADRDFYPSHCGFGEPLASSKELHGETFCHHAIAADGPLIIADTHLDPVYRRVPTVESLGVRAYAGIPIHSSNGLPLGSFCVIDFQPRSWSQGDIEVLIELAASAEREIQLRERSRRAEEAETVASEYAEKLELQALELRTRSDELEAQTVELETQIEVAEQLRIEANSSRTAADEANQAKTRFLANMSHELRTPINAILGYADLLSANVAAVLNETQRSYVERLASGGRHLANLVNEILDLAKVESGELDVELEAAGLNEAAESAIAMIFPQAGAKSIVVVTELDETETLSYYGDPARVHQVVLNVLSNSVKFTNDGGRIAVRTRSHAGSPPFESDRTGAWSIIEIEDTGIGISIADLEKIFEPFVQLNERIYQKYEGTGLGLAISRRLARLMGGELCVESSAERGSCFTLWLPSAPERLQLHSNVERGSAPAVVVFGQNVAVLSELAEKLSPAVRLVWSSVPSEVVSIVQNEGATLVLLDASIQDGEAWNLAKAFLATSGQQAVATLLLPSLDAIQKDQDLPGINLGWISLVAKPLSSHELRHAVHVAGASHRSHTDVAEDFDVLIVDDDADTRRIASTFLSEANIGVREAPDGDVALSEMRDRRPGVVLLDLMMPTVDGFRVLEEMRNDPTLSDIPVVVITAKTLSESEKRFLNGAAVKVLQKGTLRFADVVSLILRATQLG